jgi:hypothetical protein
VVFRHHLGFRMYLRISLYLLIDLFWVFFSSRCKVGPYIAKEIRSKAETVKVKAKSSESQSQKQCRPPQKQCQSINQNAQLAMLAGKLTLTKYFGNPEPRRE